MENPNSLLGKLVFKFTDTDYKNLYLKYMKDSPEELTAAIRSNEVLMKGIEDIALKIKLTGETKQGLGAVFQMGLQIGYFLVLEKANEMTKNVKAN